LGTAADPAGQLGDLSLNANDQPSAARTLHQALALLHARLEAHQLKAQLDEKNRQMVQLTAIGIALSAERNLNTLLTLILSESRKLAGCDAGSLFLVERPHDSAPRLLFKLTQNDSISFPFQEQSFPLDGHSIAGFVALSGQVLNLEDAYHPPPQAPWRFNSSFDSEMGYRTRSMLVIPMKNHQEQVLGVLQFINRKRNMATRLVDEQTTLHETVPFDEVSADLLLALASQAAVAIDNSLLLASIQSLFEGFVKAAVTAIEQRDPTTSGHSFRVAELTTLLAYALPRSGLALFRDATFDEDAMLELRYASLLHDFGKVGVREHVLVKSEKLPAHSMEILRHRFALYREMKQRRFAEALLALAEEEGLAAMQRQRPTLAVHLAAELAQLELYLREIEQANKPSILAEGRFNHLERVRDLAAVSAGGMDLRLLNEEEFQTLSLRKGSLTPTERKEIESHVMHTYSFLNHIPWTEALRRVPVLAVAHHEKLDGSGYPHGLQAEAIPLGAKMMTVSDIYDALTASDRPYKTAMSPERACAILEAEARAKLLDEAIVRVFIEARIFSRVDPRLGKTGQVVENPHARSVCEREDWHEDHLPTQPDDRPNYEDLG
jgi:HD-GYP domain-containing protein (c-di-GMP phosphodiesterase class II)